MPSSLAAQLAKAVSLNAPLLSESQRKKQRAVSYLFSSSSAQSEDIDSIHALALNALAQLRQLYPAFRSLDNPENAYHQRLFSQRAKDTDRTLLAREDVKALDTAIKHCLKILGPCLMDVPAGKIIEWLVRRFRVNEFNVQDILALFLPYHDSPHFAKMVSILVINQSSIFHFLLPFKQAAKPLPRNVLAAAMQKSTDLARFIVSLLTNTLDESLRPKSGLAVHRTLIAFNLATTLEYVTLADQGGLGSSTMAFLLPAILMPLTQVELEDQETRARNAITPALKKDSILGSYVLLSALSHKVSFNSQALTTIVTAMIRSAADNVPLVDSAQLLTALVSVCGPQEAQANLSSDVVEVFFHLNGITKAIRSSFAWAGLLRFVQSLVPHLVSKYDDDNAISGLELILHDSKVPNDIVALLTKALLETAVNEAPVVGRRLEILTALRQRHPGALQSCADAIGQEDEAKRAAVEKVILDLSMPSGESSSEDVILAAADADAAVRCAAVRDILKRMSSKNTSATELASLANAITSRFVDTHPNVIDAIYSVPETAVKLFISNPSLLASIPASLTIDGQPSRSLIRSHLSFCSSSLFDSSPEQGIHVILNLVLPFGLLSKPRQRTAATVWATLCSSSLIEHPLLNGVKDIVKNAAASGGEKVAIDVEDMARINVTLCRKLAENIQACDSFALLVDWLLKSVQSNNGLEAVDPHTRILALLVAKALVARLSGTHHISVAKRLVDAIVDGRGQDDLQGFADKGDRAPFDTYDGSAVEASLVRGVVLKPSSRLTLQRVLFNTIATILCSIKTPVQVDKSSNWFDVEVPNDTPLVYIHLLRKAYTNLNVFSPFSNAVFHANQGLFKNLGSEALLFLAGVWTQNLSSTTFTAEQLSVVKHVALRHALAFFQGYAERGLVDFQTVVPALLHALCDGSKTVRQAAIECLSAISQGMGAGAKPTEVYAYDIVYGSASASLQYVDCADQLRYLQIVVEYSDHLIGDPGYLTNIHHENLTYDKKDGKKDTKFKQRILCFLLSHVVCWPSTAAKVMLLRSLKEVHNIVKLQTLLPLLQSTLKLGNDLMGSINSELMQLMLMAFDNTTTKDLTAEPSTSWQLLLNVSQSLRRIGQATSLWTGFLSRLVSLFPSLPSHRQLELCKSMIKMGSTSNDSIWGCKDFLRKCIKQAPLLAQLLKDLRPGATDTAGRDLKRSKLDSAPASDPNAEDLTSITFFAEVMVGQHLPGSLELVSELLEVLSGILNSGNSSQSEAGYIEQLLMSAIDSAASEIKELPNLSPKGIQLDVLVKLMRTDNPQTFNQALLLMASLARLSSESVLRNVLPIFTFMGSNVFHRDDSYSFKVIQKTTEGIMPVVTASLREKYPNRRDLFIGTRDLLKTFTDASTHVPKHRRTNFFVHLITVMEPADFLTPLCMLLVDKSSNKVARQDPKEASVTLSLPLALCEAYSPAIRIDTAYDILMEANRVMLSLKNSALATALFLHDLRPDDADNVLSMRKKQCQSLLIFVGHVIKQIPLPKLLQNGGQDMQKVITLLLEMVTSCEDTSTATAEAIEIKATTNWTLLRTLEMMPVDNFAAVVLGMVQSPDKNLQEGSLRLLAEKLPEMTIVARERIQSVTAQILESILKMLASAPNASLLDSALMAVNGVALTAQPKDEAPLSATVPQVLRILQGNHDSTLPMSLFPTMAIKLGPRMIPFLRQTVDTITMLLKSLEASNQAPIASGIDTLIALVGTIPTFWGIQEIKAICDVYLDNRFAGTLSVSKLEKLVKVLAKQASKQSLLAALFQLWPATEQLVAINGMERAGRFFDLLKRCLQQCSRSDVVDNLRTLFTHFLQSFDFRTVLSDSIVWLEDKLFSAYLELVVKLNEATFQPLFRRSCDWAFGDKSSQERKVTFNRMYTALLDLFKELMTPYMSFVIGPFTDSLTLYTNGELTNQDLWSACIETATKCLITDEGVFWTDERLRLLSAPLSKQIPVCVDLKIEGGKEALTECLVSLVGCADSDAILKAANHAIISHSRSEDARVRLFALSCSVAIWQKHGKKLSDFGIQTATFIMECAEDENDDVIAECRKLRDAVEAQVGKIEGL